LIYLHLYRIHTLKIKIERNGVSPIPVTFLLWLQKLILESTKQERSLSQRVEEYRWIEAIFSLNKKTQKLKNVYLSLFLHISK
jgi:hypothetical protein